MTIDCVPNTMRAVLYSQPANTLKLVDKHPIPQPRLENDEHLLRVHSMAITNGELTWGFPPEAYKDYSPGVEMSGVVVVAPPNSRFPAGSHVYMRTTSPRSGSAREYTIGLGKELALQPRNLTPEQAAAVPVNALTAWQALFIQAGCSPRFDQSQTDLPNEQRKKVLIIGASGSVGHWAVQLAHAAGLWVVGTSHTRNTALVKDLGVHEVIDYTKSSIRQWMEANDALGKFGLVLDCVGPGSSIDAWHAARPDGGLVLSIVASPNGLKWTLDRPEGVSADIEGRFFIMESNGEQLQQITELIEAGTLRPVVDSVFQLEDYQQAFDRVDGGRTTGKVVIRVSRDQF